MSVTEFITDGKKNILPGNGLIKGDARALSDKSNDIIEKNMKEIVEGLALANGIKSSVNYIRNCPVTINAETPTHKASKTAKKLVGEDKVNDNCEPRLFSEDFSIMSQNTPGCFILMGNGTKGSNGQPLHSSDYDFNDDALVVGSSYWSLLVEDILNV